MLIRSPPSPPFPTRRSSDLVAVRSVGDAPQSHCGICQRIEWYIEGGLVELIMFADRTFTAGKRSEEHTSELQSLRHLVCRLLLEKKKSTTNRNGDNRRAGET